MREQGVKAKISSLKYLYSFLSLAGLTELCYLLLMESIRSFIALDLPPVLISKLNSIIRELKPLARPGAVHWVPAQNMHLTLKFLGDATPDQILKVQDIIDAECRRFTPFEVSARGLGAFPSINRAKVLWVGLTLPPGLKELQVAIDNATAELGFPGENRPFSPHLTLGRISDAINSRDMDNLIPVLHHHQDDDYGTFVVTELHLYRSDLQPGGSKYTRLFTAQLKMTH
jgi:RNA 2',3'-cyclic 3'-phosphodiesterase